MPKVELRQGESQQQLLRRFRKAMIRSKVLSEVRKRRWHVSKAEKRRMEDKKAARRHQQRLRRYQNNRNY